MSECSGHCCVGFVLHVEGSTAEAVIAELSRRGGDADMPPKGQAEAAFVADMLIPYTGTERSPADPPYHRFSCKHFKGNRCSVYAKRPSMCRAYGVSRKCETEGCTLVYEPSRAVDYWKKELSSSWPRRGDHVVRVWMRETIEWIRSQETTDG